MDGQAPREWLRVPLVQEEQPEAKAASPAGAGPPSVETLASFAGVALRTPPEWWQRGWPTPTTDSGACEVLKRGSPYCSPNKNAAVWCVAATTDYNYNNNKNNKKQFKHGVRRRRQKPTPTTTTTATTTTTTTTTAITIPTTERQR